MPFLFSACTYLLHELEKLHVNPALKPKAIHAKTREYISGWFQKYDEDMNGDAEVLLAIFSTLLPVLRCDRTYGIREGTLVKVLAKAMYLGETRRKQLEDWKSCTRQGDLASTVEKLMSEAETVPLGTVTVTEVNQVLDRVAGRCVFSSDALQQNMKAHKVDDPCKDLCELWPKLRSYEGKWVVRLLLKKLDPVIIPENPTLDAYHFLLPKFMAVQSNLERACRQICQMEFAKRVPQHPKPENRQRYLMLANQYIKPEVGVKVGRAEFMKAKSCQHVVDHAKGRQMYMQRKYDGEYCQVHIDLSRGYKCITIYSKSGRDSTVDRVFIHRGIRDALKLHDDANRGFTENCILEGELVVYNARTKKIMPFHHLRAHVVRAGRFIGNKNDFIRDPDGQLMILLFDCLLVDNTSLLHRPLDERMGHLHKLLVNPISGRCELTQHTTIDCSLPNAVEEVRRQFAKGIRKVWEGFVVKPCKSPYVDLSRHQIDKTSPAHGFVGGYNAWMKLKKDYITGLGDDSDFCIIGGAVESCHKRVAGLPDGCLTVFYAAVHLNKDAVENDGAKPLLQVVFEVKYSISKPDLLWIHAQLPCTTVPYQPDLQLEHYDIVFPPELAIPKPSVMFTTPLVFEITGGGYDKQTDCAFFTPRHPRLSRIHMDRNWNDCISYRELQEVADDTIHSQDNDSQIERDWISKLERGDRGKRPLEDSCEGRFEEPTPPGKLRRVDTSFEVEDGRARPDFWRASTMPEKVLNEMAERRAGTESQEDTESVVLSKVQRMSGSEAFLTAPESSQPLRPPPTAASRSCNESLESSRPKVPEPTIQPTSTGISPANRSVLHTPAAALRTSPTSSLPSRPTQSISKLRTAASNLKGRPNSGMSRRSTFPAAATVPAKLGNRRRTQTPERVVIDLTSPPGSPLPASSTSSCLTTTEPPPKSDAAQRKPLPPAQLWLLPSPSASALTQSTNSPTASVSPLKDANIFIPPSMRKFPNIFTDLTSSAHDIRMIHNLPHHRSPIPDSFKNLPNRVVLVDGWKKEYTQTILRGLTEHGHPAVGAWEIYDWRVITSTPALWSTWRIWDV